MQIKDINFRVSTTKSIRYCGFNRNFSMLTGTPLSLKLQEEHKIAYYSFVRTYSLHIYVKIVQYMTK